MEYKDYYQIMGVSRTATQDEIKKAYRKLARKYHPDVSKERNAEKHFKEVNEAYEVLKDPDKRSAYDQLGNNWQAGQDFKPPPDWSGSFGFGKGGFTGNSAFDFSEFFETLFGNTGASNRSQRPSPFSAKGEDQRAKMPISLEEAYLGATRTVRLELPEMTMGGQIVNKLRSLNVKIPAGTMQGQQIRLTGQGNPGSGGGDNGDLYLEIEFEPHRFYQIEGKDIYLNLPITPWEAALGATVEVPTLGGQVDLKIPAGSQSGQKMRLKGRGLPSSPKGDQYIVLQIITPPANTANAKAFYQRMAQEMAFNPRADFLKK
jgi:curved DNA-binding protein